MFWALGEIRNGRFRRTYKDGIGWFRLKRRVGAEFMPPETAFYQGGHFHFVLHVRMLDGGSRPAQQQGLALRGYPIKNNFRVCKTMSAGMLTDGVMKPDHQFNFMR